MYIVVLVTAKDKQEAKRIAAALLEEKLIACANILDGVKSLFWWEAKIDNADEVLLLLKSKKGLFNKIVRCVRMVHSYKVPEIIALPIIKGYNPYLKWIDESTRTKKRS